MFFFVIEYATDLDVNCVMDTHGDVYFKGLDVLSILGYKKPAEAVRTHVSDAQSLDVLLHSNGCGDMDPSVIPFPTNAKLLDFQQAFTLLKKISKPCQKLKAWFRTIASSKLKCSEDLDVLKRVNPKIHCLKPRLSVHPEGTVSLQDLSDALIPRPVKVEPVTYRSIGVNTDIIRPTLMNVTFPKNAKTPPRRLIYKSKKSVYEFIRKIK